MLFLYVGAESAIAGWVSSYAARSPAAQQLWAVLPSVFWGSILARPADRAGHPASHATRRRSRPGVSRARSAARRCCWRASARWPCSPASAISGLGFAPIFPVVVASYADRTGGGSLSGLVFAAANLGGATIPPLVGFVSTASGSLRVGLATVLALVVTMICLIRTAMPQSGRSS